MPIRPRPCLLAVESRKSPVVPLRRESSTVITLPVQHRWYSFSLVRLNYCWWLLAATAMLTTSGCFPADDQEEHLEHSIPAHMPLSYASAVEQLKARGKRHFDGHLEPDELTKLLDIIGWLPEIAADSDLRRQPWEQIQKISVRLEQLIVHPRPAEQRARWEELISVLDSFVPESDFHSNPVAADGSTTEATNIDLESAEVLHD